MLWLWAVALALLLAACRTGKVEQLSAERISHVRTALDRCEGGYAFIVEEELPERELADAVTALGGPKRAARVLTDYLGTAEPNDEYRLAAVTALGACGRYGVPSLIEALSDRAWRVRATAAIVICYRGSAASAAVPALRARLSDSNADVRLFAAFALGRIGKKSEPAAAELTKLLADKHEMIQVAAADALCRLGKQEHTAVAIKALVRVLSETEHPDRFEGCCVVLGDLGAAAKEAIPAIEKAMKRFTDRKPAAEALEKIREAAKKRGAP
jgi:hypothetical protein